MAEREIMGGAAWLEFRQGDEADLQVCARARNSACNAQRRTSAAQYIVASFEPPSTTIKISSSGPLLPRNPRRAAFNQTLHFRQRCHAGVSRCGHGQRAMRYAALYRPFNALAGQQSVDKS